MIPEPEQASSETRRSRGRRDAYPEACAAARAAIDRALESGCVNRPMRVFLAVLKLTVFWSKRTERVYVAQIAAEARIPGDVDERHTRRELAKLHKLGVIRWEPGRGRGKASWLSLEKGAINRPLMAPLSGAKTGPDRARKEGQIELENLATSGPPTEKGSEKVPSSCTHKSCDGLGYCGYDVPQAEIG